MVGPCGFTASKSKVRTILELTHSEGVVAEQRVDNGRLDFVTVGGSGIKPSRVVCFALLHYIIFTYCRCINDYWQDFAGANSTMD